MTHLLSIALHNVVVAMFLALLVFCVKPSDIAAAADTEPLQNPLDDKPIPEELLPFQGSWDFESFGSLKWPAELEQAQTWQWTIRGQEITWTRPGLEPVKLSFAVEPGFTREPKKWPNNIEFTFLDGPDTGEKCLGIFYWFADTDVLWICFQDPGATVGRPTKMSFNGSDRYTMLAIKPTRPGTRPKGRQPIAGPQAGGNTPLAKELQVFQGTWSFGACESELWYTELDVIQKTWTWKIQSQEISWIRWGKEIVKLSFTVDPSKTPNQIDFIFLDGPHKGQKCQGIYEFERDGIWICLTEPGAKVARPATMSFSGGSETSLLILHKKQIR